MRKSAAILIIAILILANLIAFSAAMAEDKIVTGKIQSITEGTGKAGKFIRIILEEARSLNGISYTAGVPAMCFGPMIEEARKVKAGQTISMIAQEREYQGSKSYTALKIIEAKQ
jgi:saccharopine dehydrogenase-like NADP-dependent oxidoreductase